MASLVIDRDSCYGCCVTDEGNMSLDDPGAWAQGAAAFKAIFDGLRSAIGMVTDIRNSGGGLPQNEPFGATSNPNHRVFDATKTMPIRPLKAASPGPSTNDPG